MEGSGTTEAGSMEWGLESGSDWEKTDGHVAVVNRLKATLMEKGLDLGTRRPSTASDNKGEDVVDDDAKLSDQ